MTDRKIALFLPSFRGGGAEQAMLLFAEGLINLGYQVDLIVAQAEGPLLPFVPQGARLINLAKRKVVLTIPSLVSYLRREAPIAFYSTIVNANIAALVARALAGVRCQMVVRESNVPQPGGPVTLARRVHGGLAPFLYRFADSIISVSEGVADDLCELVPTLRNKIAVLPNPVVSAKVFTLAEKPLAHPWFPGPNEQRTERDFPPVVLGAGRLHPQKDFSTLIRAFAIVRKHRTVRLIILGEGPERANLEQQITELGLTEDVSLPGFVENPFPFFKRAQTFVLSSRYEGMPNALLQAMIFGTPVVATLCDSGAREVLSDSALGKLVEVGNPEQMASAILESLELPRCHSAAELVASRFSVESATREYLKVAGL